MLFVEVIYAPTTQGLIRRKIPYVPGMTIADVLFKSDIEVNYPEVEHLAVGIFSSLVPRTTLVKPGDRIEIYRALLIDPKEKRRQRTSDSR